MPGQFSTATNNQTVPAFACSGTIYLGLVDLPYVGAQQDWPTAPGAFVTTVKGVPIYDGYPSRPYRVTGKLDAVGDASAMHTQLAWQAQKHKADAVILLREGTRSGGSISVPGTTTIMATSATSATAFTGPSYSIPVEQATATAWLIQWTTDTDKSTNPK